MINGWFMPAPTIGNSQTDYRTRAIIARIGLTANTPKEAVYYQGTLDRNGQQLTGAKKYTITFKQTPPFIEPGFWSLTIYNASNYYTVPQSDQPLLLGSNSGMKKNNDGSVHHKHPKGRSFRCGQGVQLVTRTGRTVLLDPASLYAPGKAMIESFPTRRPTRRLPWWK